MKVIGIIAEYNPFHNGHLYQINKIKEDFPDSIIVVALSTHFTQRGELSIINKWNKTMIALQNKVDVVLEIPFVFSNQSADIFAYAGITLLNELKVDTLVFGSESSDREKLIEAAKVQIDNQKFDDLVKDYMDKGFNYPTSLSKAIKDITNINIHESNDILAVSYIKEIIKNNYKINIYPIKRTTSFKNSLDNKSIISAYDIRERIMNDKGVDKYLPYKLDEYKVNINYAKMFELLKYRIISDKDSLLNYHLVDEGINNRIFEAAIKSNSLNELVENIKTKRYTYNKINRIIINILTNFTKEDAKKFKKLEYIRLLGLSKSGKEYLNSIKKSINLLLYTKFEKNEMLMLEYKVTFIYELLTDSNNLKDDEIKKHVIIL